MEHWGFFLAKHGIKLIFGFKILVIGYILYDYGFFIGEKPLVAQNQALDPNAKKPESGTTKPKQKLAKNEAIQTEEADVILQRRSYVNDLLNLPEIKKDGLKKGEISRFLMLLDKKLQQVGNRTDILSQRENNLKQLENSIDQKLGKLEEEITYFKQTLQKEKEINKGRLDELVGFYKKMTPKKAAPVFEQMDKDLVVALFKRIGVKQTMTILSLMPPEKSVELTEYFGRIRSGKEYEMLKQINSSLKKEFQDCKGLPEGTP